ncbi:MAG: hypothetical protein EOO75_11535 [Myxococcales bacterium]|nr:MAG: hypothetical protein EOO75_11535 [Myxococcales bacterium]
MRAFAYPSDLASHLAQSWPPELPPDPQQAHWADVLALAYQTSMTREEERPVRLRLLLASADDLADDMAKGLLHVLCLDPGRPFSVGELRRLAPSVPFESSLVVVAPGERGDLRIWALAWSGSGWLAPALGGRRRHALHSERTIVHVAGPGRLSVLVGERFLAGLEQGELVTASTDLFASRWMLDMFASARRELVEEHERHREPTWASVDESFIRTVSQQMLRRAIWQIRSAHHGGMLLFVEPDEAAALLTTTLRAKYRFDESEGRNRYRLLVRKLTAKMARASRSTITMTGPDFLSSTQELGEVESAIFEISRLIASLAAVDGAVVLTKRFELLAFGVEVHAERLTPSCVRRALDVEGLQQVNDYEENVGTRHRAAYRFLHAHPRGLAIVISQDGSIRFVTCADGVVTYFEQQLVG